MACSLPVPALSGAVYVPFQYRLFVSPSSLTHWIVIASAVISASINMSVLLEFVCFQVPTKFAGCSVMCEWWLAHSGVGGVSGWWFGRGSGGFLRLLVFGNVGWLAMCQWLLAHCRRGGVCGGLVSDVWTVFAVRVTADAVAYPSCTTMPRLSRMTGAALFQLLCGLSCWMGGDAPISASCWIRQSRIQNRRPSMLILMLTQLLRISPSPTLTQPPRMPLRLPTPAMTRLPRATDRSCRNR